jgi:protoporphyrinogen/coproporphyrinogen III oxidase
MRRVAIIGGGIAGLTAAYELAQQARAGAAVEAVLYESSPSLGGLIETVRVGGFTIECGPDGWISAKPWARDLAIELGLESELIGSNDATRRTHIFLPTPQLPSGTLVPMPDGFHMMVPTDLDALEGSPLFTAAAIAAYRAEPARAAELRATAPSHDESVADFTLRHFGREVLDRVAAPLLSGIFGGDVHKLSVRAVMPQFVAMERTHGSLITALQEKSQREQPATIFTTLRHGLASLTERLTAAIPPHWLRTNTAVTALQHNTSATQPWTVLCRTGKQHASQSFDAVFLATLLDATRQLLAPLDAEAAQLLPTDSSSAVLVTFCYADATRVPLPPGFGFLVPPADCHSDPEGNEGEESPYFAVAATDPCAPSMAASTPWVGSTEAFSPQSLLLACTFTDQKFPYRVPPNGRQVRAFFGGAAADRLARCNNDEIAAIARLELARILNSTAPTSGSAPTPPPPAVLTVVRRWPHSLPQYQVGHSARAAELRTRLAAFPGFTLLGNSLDGVGLPDLIRAARQAARQFSASN